MLRTRIRSSDIFGRFGGEEFIVATIEQGETGAHALAEELKTAVAQHIFEQGFRLTASFGIVQLSDENTLSELISHADQALMKPKMKAGIR